MPPLTLNFDSPDSSLALAGGKGLNLAALARAGFPVPPGFIVTTEAYRAFVAANGIQDRLLAVVQGAAPDDPLALESASGQIAALFAAGRIPQDIADAITSAYAALQPPFPTTQRPDNPTTPPPNHPTAQPPPTLPLPVAVRSSATAEDLPGLSFAGQQDTYLNIVGKEAVLEAVKKCWASLWTARAIGYRARSRIAPDEVTLAVVVQQLIASEASGVLFTANPLTGRRDEMVIDASFGLGEAIVSGIVEPDHYAIDARTWTITTRKLGAKALAIVPQAGGGTSELRREAAAQQALPDEQILALGRLAGRAAAHFGGPQDVEWAWADGQLYLLQSRPITSLYPVPDLRLDPGVTGLYFSFASIQGVPDPLTPLGRDALRQLLGGIVQRVFRLNVEARRAFPDAGERLYLNFTEVVRHPLLRGLMLGGLERGDPAAKQIVLRLIEAGRLPLNPKAPHRPPGFVFLLIPRLLPGLIAAQIAPERVLAHRVAASDRFLAEIREQARGVGPGLAERLALMEKYLGLGFERVLLTMIPAVFPAIIFITLIDHWLVEWCGAPRGSALALMRGLPGNVTTEMNLKLWAAAQAIRADDAGRAALSGRPVAELVETWRRGALPAAAQAEVGRFLDEYGMRAVTEIDFARPRWRDDPASVFQTLQSYLQLTDPAAAPDAVFRRGAAEAERLLAGYAERAGGLRAAVLKFVVGRMRALAGARETPKLYLVKLLDIFRTLLLESAQGLAAAGRLERAEDIFFVPLETLKRAAGEAAFDLKSVVAANRAAYEREQSRRQLPRILLSTGEAFYEGLSDSTAGPDDLVGEAVSPGMVEGRVRVVLDPRGTRLEPGEILVCPATDPGWTPLFLAAGGLVMEIGGMVTHGSVVAREYGIPAVVGVQSATTRLKTGQRVRVDGSTGRVTLLKDEPLGMTG